MRKLNELTNIKTMKTKRFFNSLLASVMLAATAGLMTACSDKSDNPGSPTYDNKWGAAEMEFNIGLHLELVLRPQPVLQSRHW